MFFDPLETAEPAPARVSLHACVVLWLLVFALYVSRALLAPYLLDSAELAAAAFGLGVAHPPGEPLALLIGKAFSLLPFGSVAFRSALAQAASGATAVALVYGLAVYAIDALPPQTRPPERAQHFAAAAGALLFGISPGAVDVATRPEVYALASALALAALACANHAAESEDARWAVAAACLLGLGLANHPLIAGAAGLGAVVACARLLEEASARERMRMVVGAVCAGITGGLVSLYVPARTFGLMHRSDGDTLLWGDARSFAGWWWVLSARTFADKNALVQTSADPSSLPFLFMEELQVPALALAVLGIYVFLRVSRATRRYALPLLLTGAGACGAGVFGGLDPHNPDVRGYLSVAFAVAAVFAACGAAVLVARLPSHWPSSALAAVVGAALLIWPVWSLASRWPDPDVLSVPERINRKAMAQLPPRTALLTGHFETAFLLAYQRLVEGQRPDITWAHMGFARGPGYAERMLRIAPQLAPVFAAHAHGPLTADAVDDLRMPLAVEAMVPLDLPLARALNYSAGLWHWPPQPVMGEASGVAPADWDRARDRREVWGYLAWRLLQDAELACSAGHPFAAALVQRLLHALPADEAVVRLARTCPARTN